MLNSPGQGQILGKYLFNLVGWVILKQDRLVLLLCRQNTPIHCLIIQCIIAHFGRYSISSVFFIVVLSKKVVGHLYSNRRSSRGDSLKSILNLHKFPAEKISWFLDVILEEPKYKRTQPTRRAIRKKLSLCSAQFWEGRGNWFWHFWENVLLPQKALLICRYLGEKVVREKLYRSLAIFQVCNPEHDEYHLDFNPRQII